VERLNVKRNVPQKMEKTVMFGNFLDFLSFFSFHLEYINGIYIKKIL